MASLDTRRPAAQEQLAPARRPDGIDTLPIIAGQSPTEIAARAVQAAKLGGHDVVILDTAGRTHIDEPLMVEMADIKKKSNPHEILLVADSLTGQDAVNLARNFDERVGITGLVLTRMDGDGRGGAALSMRAVTGKPIKLIGTGEKMDASWRNSIPAVSPTASSAWATSSRWSKSAAENIDAEKAAAMAAKMARASSTSTISPTSSPDAEDGRHGRHHGHDAGMSGMKDRWPLPASTTACSAPDRHHLVDDQGRARQSRHAEAFPQEAHRRRLRHRRRDINKLLKMHRQMADMMKMMGGKGKGGMMKQMMGGLAGKMGLGGLGMGGMGGMPDLSNMDPKQLEALQKQAEAAGLGKPGAVCRVSAAWRVVFARSGRREAAGPRRWFPGPSRIAQEEVKGSRKR
jgi:signal recognition particle subunit SRP54